MKEINAFVKSILLSSSAFCFALASASSWAGGANPPAPGGGSGKYSHVDPNGVVPKAALKIALEYYDANKSKIPNTNYLTVIDFTQHSGKKRMYVINMKNGSVWQIHTAHGSGSDRNHDGYADKFSNVSGSNASSLGFYRTAEIYNGSNGRSMRLDGLSKSNSNARARAVVIHGATYVNPSYSKMGRSWGCPAVSFDTRDALYDRIGGGSIIFAYHADYY